MTFDNFSNDAKRVLATARDDAKKREQQVITPDHFLLALLTPPDSVVPRVLRKIPLDLSKIRAALDEELGRLPRVQGAGEPYLTDEALEAVHLAEAEAGRQRADKVSPMHLLLAILDGPSAAALALRQAGATGQNLRDAHASLDAVAGPGGRHRRRGATAPGATAGTATPGATTGSAAGTSAAAPGSAVPASAVAPVASFPEGSALWRYTRDLTALARAGELDAVIGRDDEMRRIIQILARRAKNNPVVIGEPGVGKTAIVEGLAQRIASGDVPLGMKDRRMAALDLGAIVAGARARGEFEQRLRSLLGEIAESEGEVILFIDEMHTIIGAGAGDGSLNAAEMLKPALARGELTVIGATTTDEYRKHIEEDPALERRFLPIMIEEPDEELATAILRGIKNGYEIHHGVRIDDDAVVASVKLSTRYITERSLPDKAIDLMDEAASLLRMELDSIPTELDDAERELQQLKIELRALEKEQSVTATRRRAEVQKRVAASEAAVGQIRGQWEHERELIAGHRQALAEKEAADQSLQAAERAGELGRAAELKYGAVPRLQEKITSADTALADLAKSGGRLLKEHVGADDVAKVVALWTSIPVSRMLEEERTKLVQMDDRLRQRVVGQDHAIKSIGDAVRLARAGLGDPGKPIGSFMFLGPTGVGKTELARALAEFLFDDEGAMVRLDMGEFMEKAAAQRLTGAPPGYVGYDEGGQLTEAVRRRPYAVLLFDEVEKAHPDVFNTLLQLLDEGRLTDSHGKTANFANTVVIMTSNLGGADILELSGTDDEEMEKRVRAAVKTHFRPEFVNRIDDILIFRSLGKPQLELIFEILFKKLRKLLDPRQIGLEVTPAAKTVVVEAGFDPRYGARPLKRALAALIQKPLAGKLLAGEFADNDVIVVDAGAGTAEPLTFAKKSAVA